MCQSKANGGQRYVNSSLSSQRALSQARDNITATLAEYGSEWGGDVQVDISSVVLAKAYNIAIAAHAFVRRTSGEVYINHPLRVAAKLQLRGFNDDVIAIAILHDAVEDSSLTLEGLRRHGFNNFIVSGVDSVTKRSGETPMDSVRRAAAHPGGRLVKLSDNDDNSSEDQLRPLPLIKRYRVVAKYSEARSILREALYAETSTVFQSTVKADSIQRHFV